jgi:polyphosphate kinase
MARSVTSSPAPRANGLLPNASVKGRYFSREISWIAFNRRVLEEAQDSSVPLIERAKFLAIVASNNDEFTMVRMAELWTLSRATGAAAETTEAHEARRIFDPVRLELNQLVADQYTCWSNDVAPQLAAQGYQIIPPAEWTDIDRETLRKYYLDQLEAVLTPLAVDPARPFPLVANRGICVAVQLVVNGVLPVAMTERKNALISVPSGNRLIALVSKPGTYALIEDIILANCGHLFPGHTLVSRCLFRPTRDGSLDIDEQDATDLLQEIEDELSSRDHGQVVRIEVEANGDPVLLSWLEERMHLSDADVVRVDGPLDLTFLFGVAGRLPERADLCDPPLVQSIYPPEEAWADPFACLRDDEILLHHPYQSFQRVVEFVERSADDAQVLAIKQTLYRTSGNSPIVKALIRAARSGKQVTVLMELKARFDEAANIRWARALEEAGAHVIYGLVGYKVHAKLTLVIRRDEDGIRRYCHLGTGNYNDKTARLYTDFSYLTCNEAVGRDVAALFNMITGYSQPPEWERLAVAPLTLRTQCVTWIRREAAHAKAGRAAKIVAKFNALVDEAMCEELYAASQAGVEIELIVRGMCILRPGVPGLSEKIRVRSIVGRFLEHSRVFYFHNDGEPVYAIASADWMTRNLDRRVECLVRIEEESLVARLQRILDITLADNAQARVLGTDGVYVRMRPARGDKLRPSQIALAAEAELASAGGNKAKKRGLTFIPRKKGR